MPSPTLTPATTPLLFESGNKGRCFVLSTDGSTMIELPVHKWEFAIDGKNQMVGNNRDGRLRIPGVIDITNGSLTMYYDNANNPALAAGPNVRQGVTLSLQLNVDNTTTPLNSYRFLAIVDQVKPSSEFDGTENFDVSFSLQSGGVKYPGDT